MTPPDAEQGFRPLSTVDLDDWTQSGSGRFKHVGADEIETEGGPGILWYTPETFTDFVLRLEWQASSIEDNSGVYLRIPPLGTDHPDDWKRAITEGYEIQIDDRGVDPEHDRLGSPLHLTGAVYTLASATTRASCPIGTWNGFEITAQGPRIAVVLNDVPVSRLDRDIGRLRQGHIGLQNHHAGARVRFRRIRIRPY